jgi:uncharacterized protein YaiE (UPF0345 family)
MTALPALLAAPTRPAIVQTGGTPQETHFDKENGMSSTQFDHVSVAKKANIYNDGKCISHNLMFPDQTRKTIGVIMPGTLTFAADKPEVMEIIEGKCRARVGPDGQWKDYEGGQQFRVPAQSSFEIEVLEPVHYVCHFANQ